MKLELNKSTFWDVNLSSLDLQQNASFIIERVFQEGYFSEIQEIIKFYNYEFVLETLKNASWLDNKTLNFCSILFNINIKEFRCYTKKQSTEAHWAF
jgi:hypothetical protein